MRVGVISDIHSNLQALEAVQADMGTVDQVWCLGDVVGYGPDPNACVDFVRQRVTLCIAGNHDWASLGKVDLALFNADAQRVAVWTREQLLPENLTFLETLGETITIDDICLAHGSPRDPIWEYLIYPTTVINTLSFFSTHYALVGHTHIPVIFRIYTGRKRSCDALRPSPGIPFTIGGERLILNPGSVGQPRDGIPDASYLILDTETHEIEYRRVAYDVQETQRRMREAGLPARLIARLEHGW